MTAMVYWILAGLLMALVVGTLSWPLLRRRPLAAAASRRAINTAIYRDQLAELARDRDSGALAATDYQRGREELERRVLEDTEDDAAGREAAVATRGVPRTALALLVLIPLVAVPLYLKLGNPAGLNPPPPAPSEDASQQMTPEKLTRLAAGLAAKLEKNPDNPQGWVMLGRSYKALGRLDEAEKAFEHAGPVMDTEPALMLEQVELSAYKNNGHLSGKAVDLVQKLVQLDPPVPMALVYAGSDAFYRQQYPQAIAYWQKLLPMVRPDSEDAKNLNNGIAKARELMAAQGGKMPAAGAGGVPSAAGAQASAPAPAKGAITGRVDLAADVKAKAAPQDTVYVFARAVEGPRMPLAVVKARVSDLPFTFVLDDSTAMSPDLKLSMASAVRIEARVSKSGDAIAKPGDLSGSAGPVKPGAKGVKLKIDKVVN